MAYGFVSHIGNSNPADKAVDEMPTVVDGSTDDDRLMALYFNVHSNGIKALQKILRGDAGAKDLTAVGTAPINSHMLDGKHGSEYWAKSEAISATYLNGQPGSYYWGGPTVATDVFYSGLAMDMTANRTSTFTSTIQFVNVGGAVFTKFCSIVAYKAWWANGDGGATPNVPFNQESGAWLADNGKYLPFMAGGPSGDYFEVKQIDAGYNLSLTQIVLTANYNHWWIHHNGEGSILGDRVRVFWEVQVRGL